MVSRAAFLKSVPTRSRNWTVSNAEKHRKFLRAERCKRTAPTARFLNRHRYQMVWGQINGVQPNVLAKKHNTTRCNVRVVFWYEIFRECHRKHRRIVARRPPLHSEFSEGAALTIRPLYM